MADRYLALLRGINVGGHRVTGPELIDIFAELGLESGATFLASGNVIFSGDGGVGEDTIAAGLAEALGYDVPVFLRSADEVRTLASSTTIPPATVEASEGKLQLIALKAQPPPGVGSAVLALATDDDQLAIEDHHIWWLPSGGMSTSELDLKAIERLAGPTTIRTRNTIDRIAARFFAD
ncbi:MAG: DUF1697 domain-containing protein [Actinomycetia bacterium]|nr:DUF1697 domain-containing protein [Actinomycetes bacterium]